MFISLPSTCIQNFRNWHARFDFLSHSVAVVAWSGIQCVDPQMIHFELFYHLVRRSQLNPQTIFVYFRQLENIYIGHSSKNIIIPASFHSKAFVLLYKFETSWALLGRLSRGVFFAISGGSNFKHFKQLFMTLSGLGSLTMWELPRWVSYFVSSLL